MYGEIADHWEEYEHIAPRTYVFHITVPNSFDGLTEEQARDYLADDYPEINAETWEINE